MSNHRYVESSNNPRTFSTACILERTDTAQPVYEVYFRPKPSADAMLKGEFLHKKDAYREYKKLI